MLPLPPPPPPCLLPSPRLSFARARALHQLYVLQHITTNPGTKQALVNAIELNEIACTITLPTVLVLVGYDQMSEE